MPSKTYDMRMPDPTPRAWTGPSIPSSTPARYYSQETPPSFDHRSAAPSPVDSPWRVNGPYSPVPPSARASTLIDGQGSTNYASHDDEKDAAAYDDYDQHSTVEPRRGWGSRRKVIVAATIAAVLILGLALGLGLGLGLNHSSPYSLTLSNATVTNETSFVLGGATRRNVFDLDDGVGPGEDIYTYYSGPSENFPAPTSWASFGDMWAGNYHILKTGCSQVYQAQDNSGTNLAEIYNSIQNRASVSFVDHRLILAVILQETAGCVRADATTSYGGVSNTGLMQAHNGHTYSASHSNQSILAMVQDGTQGTTDGWGYVQNLNTYGSAYRAARGYNSGIIPTSGNLSEAAGATACYVSDIANRLTGWANGTRHCTE